MDPERLLVASIMLDVAAIAMGVSYFLHFRGQLGKGAVGERRPWMYAFLLVSVLEILVAHGLGNGFRLAIWMVAAALWGFNLAASYLTSPP